MSQLVNWAMSPSYSLRCKLGNGSNLTLRTVVANIHSRLERHNPAEITSEKLQVSCSGPFRDLRLVNNLSDISSLTIFADRVDTELRLTVHIEMRDLVVFGLVGTVMVGALIGIGAYFSKTPHDFVKLGVFSLAGITLDVLWMLTIRLITVRALQRELEAVMAKLGNVEWNYEWN